MPYQANSTANYRCREKLTALIKDMLNEPFISFDYIYGTMNAEKMRRGEIADTYTLRRLAFYDEYINRETLIFRELSKYIDMSAKLDDLFSANPILEALKKGEISFEFVLTMNESEINYALNQIQENPESIASKLLEFRNNILAKASLDYENLWKLLIDQKDHEKGPYVYDFEGFTGEAGYLCGVQRAFMYLMDNIDKKITPELVIDVYKRAVMKVNLLGNTSLNVSGMNKEELDFGRFPCCPGTADESEPHLRQKVNSEDLDEIFDYGFSELFGYEKNGDVFFSSKLDKDIANKKEYVLGRMKKEHSKNGCETLKDTIDEYYQRMSTADTDDKKLYAIARLGKMIDVQHPFIDGNMRTVVLLINKLLIENRLSPTIMSNPNNIDVKNSHWVVEHLIKPGQLYFQKAVAQQVNLKARQPSSSTDDTKLPASSKSFKKQVQELKTNNDQELEGDSSRLDKRSV